ncbi:MAG: hypothetical protein A2Z42_04030 [Candidatus Woykebacteria bacterium RBG_19FT_COMBO_43_10]|uniref:Uncharacterized protein n=1 Tax=Candidatus Woykebacteria bacterium RBG_19FT_COMBO_43_10 TaxID=1802598 RepID=A0A1G1WHY1_9BACT|nr:MAG: hypothetical protein A2Z42_04030 [Candidatus Woykebacteria bacterium RBG_19FT_COMBO_43_10]
MIQLPFAKKVTPKLPAGILQLKSSGFSPNFPNSPRSDMKNSSPSRFETLNFLTLTNPRPVNYLVNLGFNN